MGKGKFRTPGHAESQKAGFEVESQCTHFQASILPISLSVIIDVSLSTMYFYFLLISSVPFFEQLFPQSGQLHSLDEKPPTSVSQLELW